MEGRKKRDGGGRSSAESAVLRPAMKRLCRSMSVGHSHHQKRLGWIQVIDEKKKKPLRIGGEFLATPSNTISSSSFMNRT